MVMQSLGCLDHNAGYLSNLLLGASDFLLGCDAGYMPSDLYNLNSAYGTVEELKQCIEEMHAQDLLVSLKLL